MKDNPPFADAHLSPHLPHTVILNFASKYGTWQTALSRVTWICHINKTEQFYRPSKLKQAINLCSDWSTLKCPFIEL